MKRYLAIVKENNDPKEQKLIQASIIGLTDNVPTNSLPWAFPLDDNCIVPPIHSDSKPSKVWIYIDKEQESEDYDYNRQWYRRCTEETYKECYDYTNSDSYKIKNSNKISDEPALPTSVEYPKNKVIKFSNITVEYDEGNKRFCVTDETGNYIELNKTHVIVKGVKPVFLMSKEGITLKTGDSPAVQKLILGETLDTFLGSIKSWLDTHVHQDPISGVTGTPLVPSPVKPTLVSSKNKSN